MTDWTKHPLAGVTRVIDRDLNQEQQDDAEWLAAFYKVGAPAAFDEEALARGRRLYVRLPQYHVTPFLGN